MGYVTRQGLYYEGARGGYYDSLGKFIPDVEMLQKPVTPKREAIQTAANQFKEEIKLLVSSNDIVTFSQAFQTAAWLIESEEFVALSTYLSNLDISGVPPEAAQKFQTFVTHIRSILIGETN